MERLWTPWRYEYVSKSNGPALSGVPEALSAWPGPAADQPSCVFCNMIAAVDYAIEHGMAADEAERAAHLLVRGRSCFLCLNAFPYSTGHILIVPYRHVDSLAGLAAADAQEMMRLAQQVESVLRAVYRPSGLNFGLNLGEAGGAGIAEHIHMHALPRWLGDTNFMTAVAETRVLPETLATTWRKIREAWAAGTDQTGKNRGRRFFSGVQFSKCTRCSLTQATRGQAVTSYGELLKLHAEFSKSGVTMATIPSNPIFIQSRQPTLFAGRGLRATPTVSLRPVPSRQPIAQSAQLLAAQKEPEDAGLTGGTRSLDRRLLALNLYGRAIQGKLIPARRALLPCPSAA